MLAWWEWMYWEQWLSIRPGTTGMGLIWMLCSLAPVGFVVNDKWGWWSQLSWLVLGLRSRESFSAARTALPQGSCVSCLDSWSPACAMGYLPSENQSAFGK